MISAAHKRNIALLVLVLAIPLTGCPNQAPSTDAFAGTTDAPPTDAPTIDAPATADSLTDDSADDTTATRIPDTFPTDTDQPADSQQTDTNTDTAPAFEKLCGGDKDLVYVKGAGTPGRDIGYGLSLLDDGGFVVVATAGPYQAAKTGLLHRFNKFGHKLWQRSYGPGKDNSLFAIAPLANGGFAMVGQIAEDGSYQADMHLIVTDSDGKVGGPGTWTYIEGHAKYKDAAYGITVGHNNVLVMVGETRGKNTS